MLVYDEDVGGPVDGATVTLIGTDPSSIFGLVGTTDLIGTVTFAGVTGPYSVTAQKEILHLGTNTRYGTSLVDISPIVSGSPLAGTIGLLLFADLDPGPFAPDATLTGTISNPPTLVGSQVVVVEAYDRATGNWVAGADASGGFYSMPIPSNVDLDCHVTHREGFGSTQVLSSMIRQGVGPAVSGGTLTEDYDFAGPTLVLWNIPVLVTATNIQPGLPLGLQLVVGDLATGMVLDFSIHDGPLGPVSVNLPDATDPNLSAFSVEFGADAGDPFEVLPGSQELSYRLVSTPNSLAFDFMPLPTITYPTDGSTLTLSELACLTPAFVEGASGSLGNNGANVFFISNESGMPPPGIDGAVWLIIVPGGVQGFDIPASSLPMFASGQDLQCLVSQTRFEGVTFGYETFFNGNLPGNLANLDASFIRESYSEGDPVSISLTSDTYCTAGTSASGCLATLSTFGTPSASASAGFLVAATFSEGGKDGLFFFGTSGRQANPWGNGTSLQCVVPPVKRGGLLAGSGTTGQCNGFFSQDLNARWTAKPAQNPGAGALAQAQLWYRDPQNTSNQTTSLSDAVEFCVQP